MLFCLDQLPDERSLSLLPAAGRRDILIVDATSPTAMELGRWMYRRLPIDWEALDYDDRCSRSSSTPAIRGGRRWNSAHTCTGGSRRR